MPVLDDAALLARVEALEIRVAYQDETIEELNAALTAQWQEIDRLRREFGRLAQEMAEAAAGAGQGAPEKPPPHY